jgi:4-amino-4-deoxy-L-arabinose transferase-like glycosyltransferase
MTLVSGLEEVRARAVRRTPRIRRDQLGISKTGIALVVILGVGVGLRLWLVHLWRPAFLGYPDAAAYVDQARIGAGGLSFWDPRAPGGYPLFLSWLHAIRADLTFATVVQHAMGLAAGLFLYSTVARFVRRSWVALLPLLVVALAGSEIYLEHAALSETLYTLLVVVAIWCAARSYDSGGRRAPGWLAGAGILIGIATTVRPVAAFLAPVLVCWATATRGRGLRRLGAAVVATVAFAAPVGGYLIYQHSQIGTWGLTRIDGDILYARSAIFADCRNFTPPVGTERLCQPPGAPRLGPAWRYQDDSDSPAVRLFGQPAYGPPYRWPPDKKLKSFAVAAIENQPWQYIWTTAQGFVKYVAPSVGTKLMMDGYDVFSGFHNPQFEAHARPVVEAYYPHHAIVHHDLGAISAYGKAARVAGPVTGMLLAFMITGLVLTRGRRRAASALLGATTVVMLLVPVAFQFYSVRFATPAYGPLAAVAAIGLDAVLERVRGRVSRSRRKPAESSAVTA